MRIKEVSSFHHLLLIFFYWSRKMRIKQVSSFHHLLPLLFITCSYFQYYYTEGCHEEERRTLLKIKDSMYPIMRGVLSNWVGKDCCKWDRIKCDNSSSRIVYLDLTNVRNWTDELGSWNPNATLFTSLKMLTWLSLSGNLIGRDLLQSMGNLKKLGVLDLSHNHIGSHIIRRDLLQSMSSLKNLTHLDLHNNGMDGNGTELLQVVCQFNQIEQLNIAYHSLEGVVPPCVGNLTSLTYLSLSLNKFQGNIPSLGRLNALETLYLSHNQFQGNILHILGENHPIRMRDASNFSNATTSPPWKKLQRFNVGYNEFSGDGGDLAQVVCQLSHLETLYIAYNSLEGVVPPCFANLTSLRAMSLSENKFTGNIPTMDKMNALEYLNLSDNRFEGDILNMFSQNHSVRYMSSLHGNMSSPLKNLLVLDLSNNALTGDGWEHFQAICQVKSLEVLSLDHNSLEGRLHPCLGMKHSISHLDLSHNQFQGSVPAISDGFNMDKSSLEYLDLSYNRLEGDILTGDSNMNELRFLKLKNNLFTRLTMLPRQLILVDLTHNHLSGDIYSASLPLPHLRVLLLGKNHLEGKIPKQLCEMKLLQLIDLSDNNLSGKIPSCLNNISSMVDKNRLLYEGPISIDRIARHSYNITFDNLTADFTTKGNSYTYVGDPFTFMTGIDLSRNQLTGGIPSEIGDLRNLRALNLSNNHLSGSLPTSFQNMESIESLDLSCNELLGALPLQLTQLNSLSVFNVSFNNLSGNIPFNHQFSTFKYDSFMGNAGLCGLQVEIKCSTNTKSDHKPPQPNFDDEDGATSLIENRLFFYSWVAISYTLGLWVIGILIFCKKWRQKYFRIIDEYIYTSLEKFWILINYFKVCN